MEWRSSSSPRFVREVHGDTSECLASGATAATRASPTRGQDVELLDALRDAFPGVRLQVDANTDYGPDDSPRLRKLDEYGLLMIEQPFAPAALRELACLQRTMKTPICLDESLGDLEALEEAVALGSLRVANIKVQRLGGLLNARAMHDACATRGIQAWVGCMFELGIGLAHGLALATLPNMVFPSDIQPTAPYFVDDVIDPGIEMSKDGTWSVPNRPGIGFEVDERTIAKYRLRHAVLS